jgi:hypothetical protein
MSRGAIPVAEGRRNGDDFYSPAQAARVLGVTPTRVRQLLQAGELERERDRADHWSIPASALVDRLDRLRRERFVEAAGYAPVSARELQERTEVLQRELGRLEGRLESEENARRYLEADRALLAKLLERERCAGRRSSGSATSCSGGWRFLAGPRASRKRPRGKRGVRSSAKQTQALLRTSSGARGGGAFSVDAGRDRCEGDPAALGQSHKLLRNQIGALRTVVSSFCSRRRVCAEEHQLRTTGSYRGGPSGSYPSSRSPSAMASWPASLGWTPSGLMRPPSKAGWA